MSLLLLTLVVSVIRPVSWNAYLRPYHPNPMAGSDGQDRGKGDGPETVPEPVPH